MPLFDVDKANTQAQLGKVYDIDAANTSAQHGKWYDVDAANTQSLLYTAEYTVTVTNYGAASGWKQSWSDSGGITWYTVVGSGIPAGRHWVYFHGGGWAYGNCYNALLYGTSTSSWVALINEWNLLSFPDTGFVRMQSYNNIISGQTILYLRGRKIDAQQGGYGLGAQCMFVPLAPIENAIGRQITAAEATAWIGTGWSGSKTITITD